MSKPSKSVALVVVERVVRQVRRHVDMNNALAKKVAERKGVTLTVAKNQLLAAAVKVALKYSEGDEKKAGFALIVTNGRTNRLPQAVKLLRKHSSKVVRTAYELKEDLSISDASLNALCDLVEHTDGDPEGEASRIPVVLDELASQDLTRKQRYYFYRRLRVGVKAGRPIEAVLDEILVELSRGDCPEHELKWKEDLEAEESFE